MKKEKPPEFIIENAAEWGIKSPERSEWVLDDFESHGRPVLIILCTRCSFPDVCVDSMDCNESFKLTQVEMQRYNFVMHGVRRSFMVGQCTSCLTCYWKREFSAHAGV